MTWISTPPVSTDPFTRHIPRDAHAQLRHSFLDDVIAASDAKGGRIRALLTSFGWEGRAFADDDAQFEHIYNHLSPTVPSLSMHDHVHVTATAERLIGQGATTPLPVDPDGYEGKPTKREVLGRIEQFGLVVGNSPRWEQEFFIERYYQNKLTLETDAAFMAEKFGLWWLPDSIEASAELRPLWVGVERATAEWGLSGTEENRRRTDAAYRAWENAMRPAPESEPDYSAAPGVVLVNPRRLFHWGRKVERQIVEGRVSDAGKACAGVAWQMGFSSAYDGGYSFISAPLHENVYRRVLDLPIVLPGGGGEGGFGIGGSR